MGMIGTSINYPSPERLVAIIKIQTEIAKAIYDLGKVMDLAAQCSQQLLNASGAVIEMVDADEMVYRAASGTAAAFLGLRLKRTGSLSGLCVEEGRPLSCNDSDTDPRVDRDACKKVGLRSMIVVPLLHNGSVVGVLKVLSPRPNAFDEIDLQSLEILSEMIGAAMSHAKETENRKEESRALFVRATHDSLTGLANRALFYDHLRISISLAQRKRDQLAILMLDMDGLKQINDTFGHQAGDAALVELASRLKVATRDSDTAARIGGDEFAVLLNGVSDQQSATITLQRTSEQTSGRFYFEGHDLNIRASMGIALYPADGTEIETLLKSADEAMYRAKRQPRIKA